jgi:NAD(P)-dependent dehydrogenase (short-subunit alcohol dehydrogenase family)
MNKNVLITGAARGLGKALVEVYLSKGHRVFALDIDDGLLKQFSKNEQLVPVNADVSDEKSVKSAFQIISEHTDKIDILINNAGIIRFYPLSEYSPMETEKVIGVNAFGALIMINQFLPMLIKSKATVVNMSSVSSKFPGAFQPYQVSKITLEAIHKTIRQELRLLGIKTVLIRAGAINTTFLEHTTDMETPEDIPVFEKYFIIFRETASRYIGKTLPATKIAKKIYSISFKKSPNYIYRFNYGFLFRLLSVLPDRMVDHFMITKLKQGSRHH